MSSPAGDPEPKREPQPGPSFEEVLKGTLAALVAAIIELVQALRGEIEGAQRSATAFVGRLLGALGRAGRLALRGMRDALIALVFAVLGLIILSIFLIAVLNKYLGDPWGTGLTALLLILGAVAFGLRSRSAFKAIEAEAMDLQR